MDKKIVTIAEISFALVFIILMSTIFINVYNAGNGINMDIENMQEIINEAGLAQYDNKVISGDTVMSTINKMQNTRNGLALSYAVCRSTGSEAQLQEANWDFYGHNAIIYENNSNDEYKSTAFNGDGEKILGIGTGSSESNYSRYDTSILPEEPGYISPVKKYIANLVFNTNGVIVGMVFIPE